MNSIELRLGDNRAGKVPALVGMSILQSVNGMFTDLKMRPSVTVPESATGLQG